MTWGQSEVAFARALILESKNNGERREGEEKKRGRVVGRRWKRDIDEIWETRPDLWPLIVWRAPYFELPVCNGALDWFLISQTMDILVRYVFFASSFPYAFC